MKSLRLLFVLLVAATPSIASAQKNDKKGGGQPQLIGASITFSEDTFGTVMPDGLGPIVDEQDGADVWADPDNPYGIEMPTSGTRSVIISLGPCISETCESPWGESMSGLIEGFSMNIGEMSAPGETLFGYSVRFTFYTETHRYNLSWKRFELNTITGLDTDGDFEADSWFVEMHPDSEVVLFRNDLRKNGRIEFGTEVVAGRFTQMPLKILVEQLP